MKVFVSHQRDPFFHLAVEEWLLREYQGELPVWFLYQNPPCVVVGRFQNPWLEADLSWMHAESIPLVRRPSGGGTVWHDEGNVNFCCVRPIQGFKKSQALEVIQAKLLNLDVPVEINARFDLVVRQADNSTRKVSGSAYKQTKDRALHHGTLLLEGDLARLERSLHSPVRLASTKSIPSVRSIVMNLSELNPTLSPQFWMEQFGEAEVLLPDDARFDRTRWSDWTWVYGETPHFSWEITLAGQNYEFVVHKGVALELEVDGVNRPCEGVLFKADQLVALCPEVSMNQWLSLVGT
jgi:lipoate-protein ligase A